jgi:hypothetical protein
MVSVTYKPFMLSVVKLNVVMLSVVAPLAQSPSSFLMPGGDSNRRSLDNHEDMLPHRYRRGA